jgi:DnaJ homolog subfamily C member 7
MELDPLNNQYNSAILFNRASAQMKLGQHKLAIVDLTKAIELNEDYVKAIMKRSEVYLKLEQFEEAVRDLERVKQIDPSTAGLRQKLQEAKLELKKSKRKDYYKILEIGKEATEEEIKKAYKRQALKWHPDKHSNGEEEQRLNADKMFKDIGEAYSVLSDPQKKVRYDQGADIEELDNPGHGGGFHGDPNDIFQMFFSGGGMGGGGGHHHGFSHGGGGGGYTFKFG